MYTFGETQTNYEREADEAEHPAALPRCYGKDQARPAYEYDLRHDLDARGGRTRSIYRPKEDPPTHREGYYDWLNRNDRVRDQQRTRMAEDLRRDVARVQGAAHPLCFTERVMQHQFPEGFKPVKIEPYDGTTDPAVWMDDFLLHIHMARGDDLHAIKYLPLKLKGPA
jgi:hypothetical protein